MKLLSKINIILPIILFIVLCFSNVNAYFVTIMTLTLVIGWLIPYLSLLLTGIAMTYNVQENKAFIINIASLLLSLLIVFFSVSIFAKDFIIIIVEYLIISLMNIVNIIIYIPKIKEKIFNKRNNTKEENKQIKKIKKENNGAIK